jgi:transglutaminase-like putative cysteine protease
MESKAQRFWDWISIVILLIALLTAAGRLYATQWTEYLLIMYGIVTIGYLLGLMLGRSTFQRNAVIGLAAAYTLIVLTWQISGIVEGFNFTWNDRVSVVASRLLFSIAQYTNYETLEDPILFFVVIALLYWIAGMLAGYHLIRHNSLTWTLIPGAVLTITISVYDSPISSRLWYTGMYLFCALLLFGRAAYTHSAEGWRANRTLVSPDSGIDLGISTLITAALIWLLAWNLPTSINASAAAYDIWREFTRPFTSTLEHISDALAPLEGTSGVSSDFYSGSLALGLGNPLSDKVVFTIEIPPQAYDHPRFYWRGRVYDQFNNNEWSASETTRDTVSPIEDDMPIPDHSAIDPQIFIVTTYIESQRLLYAPSQPVWINRSIEANFFELEDQSRDVIFLRANQSLDPGDSYQARSKLINPAARELRETSNEYPAWITSRYLQLPPDFSEKVRALAKDITADKQTPYDKTVAITEYLRANIEYVDRVVPPPNNADRLEWFLFEYKQGFCNYYATAEVLMLRAVGIPARMAAGFAQGEANDSRSRYYVRQSDAHAWPEVYFPGYGWIEFEPTMNQAEIIRPELPLDPGFGDLDPRQEDPESGNDPTPESPLDHLRDQDGNDPELLSSPGGSFIWVIIFLAIIAGGGLWMLNRNRIEPAMQAAPVFVRSTLHRYHLPVPRWIETWAAWNALSLTARAYETINQCLRWLNAEQPSTATPHERAQALIKLLPNAEEVIRMLLEEHQTGLYSPRSANPERAQSASFSLRMIVLRKIIGKFFS